MHRTCLTASWFFGTLGVLLLVCSLMLVPQSRALADDGTGVGLAPAKCPGKPCDPTYNCQGYLPPNCSNGDSDCQAPVDGVDCSPCHCLKIPSDPAGCGCF